MTRTSVRIWLARVLIGLVLFLNTQAALLFIGFPARYAPGFGLTGPVGDGMVRGMGILFLMWTVPYFVAVCHPVRQRVSLFEAIAMQAVGLIGESLLLASFPGGYPQIEASIMRFIVFDGAGLLALLVAVAITWPRWVINPAGAA